MKNMEGHILKAVDIQSDLKYIKFIPTAPSPNKTETNESHVLSDKLKT